MRYDGRKVVEFKNKRIFETFKPRKISEREKIIISQESHIWQLGDKFYKLSLKYYGNMDDWYIIAFHNQKPTDAHVELGEEIIIPFPPELVKELYGI